VNTLAGQQLSGLSFGKRQICGADIGQISGNPPSLQPERPMGPLSRAARRLLGR